jgi:hypothetical protein
MSLGQARVAVSVPADSNAKWCTYFVFDATLPVFWEHLHQRLDHIPLLGATGTARKWGGADRDLWRAVPGMFHAANDAGQTSIHWGVEGPSQTQTLFCLVREILM